MKWLLASTLGLIGLLYVQATQPNNPICGTIREGFVNDPSDCAAYYWCSSLGVAVQLQCPAGFWFDAVRNLCVAAGSIVCSKCPAIGVLKVRNPANCRMFYQCVSGASQAMTCGPGTLFNPDSSECDAIARVTCRPGTEHEPCPSTGIVNVADMTNCRVFHLCSNGSVLERRECRLITLIE